MAATIKPRLAVPSYFYPGPEWARMTKRKPFFAVINPNSGPGAERDKNYAGVVETCVRSGVNVLGYVATTYAGKSKLETRMEIAKYLEWYPSLRGFFFDEASSDKADVSYYKEILPTTGMHVLNPGAWPDEAYARLSCSLMVYETDLGTYVGRQPPGWVAKYGRGKFWHCVFGVKTLEDAAKVKRLCVLRRGGYLYVTDDDEEAANPYDRLPSYWEKL